MGRIISTRHLLVLREPRLRQLERFLADDCGHANGDPVFRWSRLLTCAWPDLLERRFPAPRRGHVSAAAVGPPDIG